ncbi:F-box protein At5g07610-like [Carex rostrata]
MDDQVSIGNEMEEITSFIVKTDPSDIVSTTLSCSDGMEVSSPGSNCSPGEEYYISDETSNYSDLMDDAYELTPVMNPINQIVTLVLPRLPARSLLRFKSVSFNFKTLISSPFVVVSHFLHPKSISGLFYQTWCGIHYVSLDAPSTNIPDPSFSYLPEPVTIKASTHGVLCVRGQRSLKYYITNPTTMEWAELPETTVEHCDNVAVVVVFDSLYNFSCSYQVVCAYPVKGVEGVYTFETFSSETWAWALSDQICPVENIVAQSGTAVGAVAYWRTTMETVLSYDPVKDRSNIMQKPHTDMNEVSWELGEMDMHLSVTSTSNQGQIKVSTMEATNKMEMPKWEEMGNFWLSESAYAMPIRSQGSAGLAFWEHNEDVIGLVLRDMEGRQVCRFEEPNYYGDIVFFPYISTLAPVKRSGAGTSAEPSVSNNVTMHITAETNENRGSVGRWRSVPLH